MRERSPAETAPEAHWPVDAERRAGRLRALLGSMRIRKKMIILHTGFSLTLALVLLLSLRPSIREVVQSAERQTCLAALDMLSLDPTLALRAAPEHVELRVGSEEELGLSPRQARLAREADGLPVFIHGEVTPQRVVRHDAARDVFLLVSANAADAKASVIKLYLFLTAALLGVYFLIALSLELVVLPRQVYGPIRALLRADLAVQEGRRADELIASSEMPSDELGEIMRSRNESIVQLRRQESALNDALERIESIAVELKRKNHLLETARRNLADQDRLASLGMMSAGIAHELNTPLAVLKGQVERIASEPQRGVPEAQAQLMLRVVRRLERLSESLLDFARVRPPAREAVAIRALVDESWTLVRLDRESRDIELRNLVSDTVTVTGDPDRLGQVFVNLLRNAADAMDGRGEISVAAEQTVREGRRWTSLRIQDQGPGIPAEVLSRLFEPFVTTRLDSKGTGLGLAVSEGIIREHGGLVLARNLADATGRTGAEFEIMLPDDPPAPSVVPAIPPPSGTPGDAAPNSPSVASRGAPGEDEASHSTRTEAE